MSIPNQEQRFQEFQDELTWMEKVEDRDYRLGSVEADIAEMIRAATQFHSLGDFVEADEFFKTAEVMMQAVILTQSGHVEEGQAALEKSLLSNL